MATEFIQPPNISHFTNDHFSSSSNVSIYTSEAHKRLATQDFGYPNVRERRSLNDINDGPSRNHEPKKQKQIREFKVSRKSTIKGPKYSRYSKSHVIPVSKANKRLSKFAKPDQIDHIVKPSNNVLENPNYVISYFTKTLELVKQEPRIYHEILRSELKNENVAIEPVQKSKSRKYQSLPAMRSQNPLVLEKKELRRQRLSAPASLQVSYLPTNLTLKDYLYTPLNFYQHGRHDSTEASLLNEETKGQSASSGARTKSFKAESVGNSIATSALSLNRSRLIDENNKSKMLKTKRKDSIIRKQNLYRDSIIDDDNFRLKQKISNIRNEKYLSKYGTPILETSPVIVERDAAKIDKTKRFSESGDISIATGDELYNDIKTQLFSKRPKTWKHALKYIHKYHPDLIENEYFMTRLMFEIYLRRILAANIALKLGSDKLHRDSMSAAWIGLKESISAVYGEDNALFFESQASKTIE